MSKTEHYGFTKPAPEDFYDVAVQNENLDRIDEALTGLETEKAPKDGPVFSGKVIVPQPGVEPEDGEAATVKFVKEQGAGVASGIKISDQTAETTGAEAANVEAALAAVGGSLNSEVQARTAADTEHNARITSLTTSLPMPTKAGQIHIADLSDPAAPKMKLAEMTGAVAKPVTGLAVEKRNAMDEYTVLAMNFNGSVTDIAGHTIESSTAQISTEIKKYGSGALDLRTGKIILAPSDDFSFGTGDVTFDAYIYLPTAISTNGLETHVIGSTGTSASTTSPVFGIRIVNANLYKIFLSSHFISSKEVGVTFNPSTIIGKWVHVAMSKSGNTVYFFIDGILIGSATSAQSYNCEGGSSIVIGNSVSGGSNSLFLADSVRISKGIARWTSNFTPPKEYEENGLLFTWTNPADTLFAQRTIVRRSSEGYPIGPDDGTTVYEGTGQECFDETADLSVDQYYTAFTVNDFIDEEKTDESMMVKYEASKGYLMLYDHGDECVDVTGGWIKANASNSVGSWEKRSNSLFGTISDSNGKGKGIITADRIAFGEFKLLGVVCNNIYEPDKGSYANVSISSTSPNVADVRLGDISITNIPRAGKQAVVIDVAGISSNFLLLSVGVSTQSYSCATEVYAAYLLKSDDYTPWLLAGNLNPSDYPTLDTLLADSTAMTTLMNNSAAVDRMIRYTGTVMAAVINSETAMAALGNSPYVTRVMQNPDWAKFLAMSPYLNVWKDQDNTKKVPVMTSDTTPSGSVSADVLFGYPHEAWRAFDGAETNDNSWATPIESKFPHWIQYKFPEPIELFCIDITPYYNASASFVKDFEVFVGDTENALSSLGTFQHDNTPTKKCYMVMSTESIRVIRLKFTSSWYNRGDTQVNEIQFFGK